MKPLTEENLMASVKEEVESFDGISLTINPSFAPRQKDIIRLCDLYYMSKYRDADLDVFYNIVTLPVEVASKMMDIDTKNIRLQAEDSDSYWPAWLKGKELDWWMKEKYFGRQLNIYPHELAKYGHLFLKKVGPDVMVVNPNNIIVRQSAESLKDTPILEYHKLPADIYYALAEKKGWENYKLTENEGKGNAEVEFYEVFYPEGIWQSDYNYFVVRPKGENEIRILTEAKLSDCPYKDLAWEKVYGRFLGKGQIERLFRDQIYLNKIANYKAEGLQWTSKHLWQTRDTSIGTNLLREIENGDILLVNSEVLPVQMEERNLAAYTQEEQRWEQNALKKSFAQEPVTGARAPAGTPFSSTMLQAQMTAGYYDQKKEDLGSFIEEVLWDWVLPEFEKENRKEHEILIENLITGGDEHSDKFFNMLISKRMNKRQLEMLKKGKWASPDQYKIMRGIQSELLRKENIKVEKGLYSDLKHKIRIDIVGEQIDTPAKLTTLQVLLQMLGSNPSIFQDKRIKKIIYKVLDLSGFNPHDFEFDETPSMESEMTQVAAQRGGSVAAPVPNQMPSATPKIAYNK